MNEAKAGKITMLFLGLKSLVIGILFLYMGVAMAPVFSALGSLGASADVATGLGIVVAVIWVIGILELLLGIFSLITTATMGKE